MPDVEITHSAPGIFYCHRLHFEQVEFSNSIWWEVKVYGHNQPHEPRGELIAYIHRDDLPLINVTFLTGRTITLDTDPTSCHIDPAPPTPTQTEE